jgi:hypothetical protein
MLKVVCLSRFCGYVYLTSGAMHVKLGKEIHLKPIYIFYTRMKHCL